jgi:hypothetical protein
MICSAYQSKAHAPYALQRERIVDALIDHSGPPIHDPDAAPDWSLKLANKLDACCRYAQVIETEDGYATIAEQRCKSRLCPRCARIRSRQLTCKVLEALRRMDSPRMLTLTLRSSNAPLRDQVNRLTESFKLLRRRPDWKKKISGGCYTIEVTYNAERDQWHPHLHAVIDGKYWAQRAIADAWESVTGDSRVVDIRFVHDAQKAAGYVASYVAKSSDVSKLPDHLIPEWAASMHGARLMQTFGKLHGVSLNPDDENERPGSCMIDFADQLVQDADRGDPDAKVLWRALYNEKTGLPTRIRVEVDQDSSARVHPAACRLWYWETACKGAARDDRSRPPPAGPRRSDPVDRTLWSGQNDPADGDSATSRPTTVH